MMEPHKLIYKISKSDENPIGIRYLCNLMVEMSTKVKNITGRLGLVEVETPIDSNETEIVVVCPKIYSQDVSDAIKEIFRNKGLYYY